MRFTKKLVESILKTFKHTKQNNSFGDLESKSIEVDLDYEILELMYMMDGDYFYKVKYSDGSTDIKKFNKEMETIEELL